MKGREQGDTSLGIFLHGTTTSLESGYYSKQNHLGDGLINSLPLDFVLLLLLMAIQRCGRLSYNGGEYWSGRVWIKVL